MTRTLPVSKTMLTLADVGEKLELAVTADPLFFVEWRQELPELTIEEVGMIDRLQARFAAHRYRGTVAKGAVEKLLLSPLLDLVGLYKTNQNEPEFEIRTEQSVVFEVVDGDEVLRGRMDTLIVRDNFWVLVVEVKRTIMAALVVPQALACMLTNMMCGPLPRQPVFGMVSNGEEFIFLKVGAGAVSQYSTSRCGVSD
jgi:hypothetical protein